MCCILSQLGWGENWEWQRQEQALVCYSRTRAWPPIQIAWRETSCLVSSTECVGNTQFQGFLLEQAVNSEFRAVLTVLQVTLLCQWIQWCFLLPCHRLGGLPNTAGLSAGVSWPCLCLNTKGKSPLQAWNLPLEHLHHRQCTFLCYESGDVRKWLQK